MCRLGILVDFLSHSTITGFMGGTATIICLQQLKGFLGLAHFTTKTDVVSVIRAIVKNRKEVCKTSIVYTKLFLRLKWLSKNCCEFSLAKYERSHGRRQDRNLSLFIYFCWILLLLLVLMVFLFHLPKKRFVEKDKLKKLKLTIMRVFN